MDDIFRGLENEAVHWVASALCEAAHREEEEYCAPEYEAVRDQSVRALRMLEKIAMDHYMARVKDHDAC